VIKIGNHIKKDVKTKNGDFEMKSLTRALAAFIAGMFFLGGMTLVLAWLTEMIKSLPIGIGGIVIVAIAIYLFFVGYKGKTTF